MINEVNECRCDEEQFDVINNVFMDDNMLRIIKFS